MDPVLLAGLAGPATCVAVAAPDCFHSNVAFSVSPVSASTYCACGCGDVVPTVPPQATPACGATLAGVPGMVLNVTLSAGAGWPSVVVFVKYFFHRSCVL